MKKIKLISLLLILALMLQGCASIFGILDELGVGSSTRFDRLYSPRIDYVSFQEMRYERPDVVALCAQIGEVTQMANDGSSTNEIIKKEEEAYDAYILFYTMSALADVYYCMDLSDSYYEEEYLYCQEQSPVVEQAMEECYIALAASEHRDALEEDSFGEDFFSYYDDETGYTSDAAVALYQEEAALAAQYMALQNDATIPYEGQAQSAAELLSDPYLTQEEYDEILQLYYETYNETAGELFIELIQVRRELAQEMGYGSYAQLAYDMYYYRDYTPEQALSYAKELKQELAPIYAQVEGYYSLPAADADEIMTLLSGTAQALGGRIEEAYDFMTEYDLYDLSSSGSKMPTSYVTYFESYEMPFLSVNPQGLIDDFLTTAHEFGHFVDAYVNFNCTTSTDCAEVFSQSMEYLALEHAELSRTQYNSLKKMKLIDSLETFLLQACYYEFEARAYELSDEELTVERLNELFYECTREVGDLYPDQAYFYQMGWIDVPHFYTNPYYVISYCVSNDSAMQVYALEAEEEGKGVEMFYAMVDVSANNTLLSMLEEAGMESPFAQNRVTELAAFFDEMLLG